MRVPRRMLIGLLGPPGIVTGDHVALLALQPKTLAVLAYVALAERPVSRRELTELLFPDSDDPRGALRWHLARLRAALPPAVAARLEIGRAGVAVSLGCDVAAFRDAADACLRDFDPDAARAALALYRGELLAGQPANTSPRFDNWLFVQESTLHTRFLRLVLALARWALEAGRPEEALDPLARLLATDPYVEEAHALRVRALAAAGGAEHARAAFDEYARVMRDDLHAEPRADLAALVDRSVAAEGALPREQFVTVDQITLHVVEWEGGDPPVLALHGAAMSGYIFTALGEHLAPDVRLVAPAIRGNGFSDKPPSGYTAEQHVRDLLGIIAALGIERPVVMGHSTGGAIATLLARRCRARGLILLDGVVGTPDDVADRFGAADHLFAAHTIPVFDVDTYVATMRRSGRYRPEAERLMERIMRKHMTRMPDGSYRGSVDPYAMRRTWASLARADTLAALARVECPVLVVWARQVTPELYSGGPYLSEAFVRRQLAAARDGELLVAEHSDHATLIRDPEPAVVQGIRRFLAASVRGEGIGEERQALRGAR